MPITRTTKKFDKALEAVHDIAYELPDGSIVSLEDILRDCSGDDHDDAEVGKLLKDDEAAQLDAVGDNMLAAGTAA